MMDRCKTDFINICYFIFIAKYAYKYVIKIVGRLNLLHHLQCFMGEGGWASVQSIILVGFASFDYLSGGDHIVSRS